MTIEEKLNERRSYVKAAFAFMAVIPLMALALLFFGIDPSPVNVIFSTSAATFTAVIVAHFATTPKETAFDIKTYINMIVSKYGKQFIMDILKDIK